MPGGSKSEVEVAGRNAPAIRFVERVGLAAHVAEDHETARKITRIQAGDSEAFGELYTLYFDRVFGYLRLLMRTEDAAEDASQQVFLQAFRAIGSYEHRRSFWVWLFTIARNQALKELRNQGRLEPADPDDIARARDRAAVDEPNGIDAIGWITDGDLTLFISRLPLPQRQVLVMRYMLDLSNEQVAAILDRSISDVRLLHHRALRFLRERLTAIGRDTRTREWSRWNRRIPQARVLRARRFAMVRDLT